MARSSCRSPLQFVLFADGVSGMHEVFVHQGAAMVGDPTAYVRRSGRTPGGIPYEGRLVWVKPGESVTWVEAIPADRFLRAREVDKADLDAVPFGC